MSSYIFAACLLFVSPLRSVWANENDPASHYVGSLACAKCHSSLYESYSKTPMALSSGKMGTGTFQESFADSRFFHSPSSVAYTVFKDAKGTYFEFARQTSSPASGKENSSLENGAQAVVHGRRRLDYFVGSGALGRSYLFSIEGFLFQAPVSYFSGKKKWDISPGYENADAVHLTGPIDMECLQCHASRVQLIRGTQNGYSEVPFLENGIGCERCHGPGKKHIAKMESGQIQGSREIVNPAKLEPVRRDSVCAQCHLTGEVRVEKAGRSLSQFRAGDLLADYALSFVWASPGGKGLTVTSHYEKLWQSRCKSASKDRLWCGSCHDPHALPSESQRTDYFRQKCLSCHQNSDCRAGVALREKEGNDCTACHMSKNRAVDAGHVVYTDHFISRLAGQQSLDGKRRRNQTLVSFWGGSTEPRDLGLAYAKLAAKEQREPYYSRAFDLLKKSAGDRSGDPEVLLQLAYLYDRRGEEKSAMALYERTRKLDPGKVEATVNLGTLLTTRGRFEEAIRLWEDALSRNPGLSAARINLALAYLRIGNPRAAEAALLKALEYNPDLPMVRNLLSELRKKPSGAGISLPSAPPR